MKGSFRFVLIGESKDLIVIADTKHQKIFLCSFSAVSLISFFILQNFDWTRSESRKGCPEASQGHGDHGEQ